MEDEKVGKEEDEALIQFGEHLLPKCRDRTLLSVPYHLVLRLRVPGSARPPFAIQLGSM